MTLTTNWLTLRRDYQTVVADPPWPYDTRDAMVRTVKADGSVALGVGDTGYKFMDMPALKALPVRHHVAKNAHLYLWTTNAFMREAHDLAEAWGFAPKTIVTWVKIKENGTPSMKTGYYFRGATEHCLFAVRGSLRLSGTEPTAILSRRLPHSVKPAEFFDMVERCSPSPRLEMFARLPRPGWSCFGDGVSADRTGQLASLL